MPSWSHQNSIFATAMAVLTSIPPVSGHGMLSLPNLPSLVLFTMFIFAVLLSSLLIVCCISRKRDNNNPVTPTPVVPKSYKPTNNDWQFWSARCESSTAGAEVKPLRNLSEESDMSRSMVVTRSMSDEGFTSRSGNHSYA